jgi:hypothetical protein
MPQSRSALLPDDVRDRARALGWSADALDWLARLLRAGDSLGEITEHAIEIIRRSGVVQRYYHPTAPQTWRQKLESVSD